MKNFLFGLLTGLVILFLAVAGYLATGLADVRADAPIPAWTAHLAYFAIHASVRRSAPRQDNPLPATEETLVAGGRLYLNDCVGCHGEPGKPPSDFGATFYPPAPQFPSSGTAYDEAQAFWISKHGIRRTGMSAQEFSYADRDLWPVAAFIRRFPKLSPELLSKIHPSTGGTNVPESPK